MTDKTTAITDLDARYQAFRAPLTALQDDAYTETWLGEWNLSQLLAHMGGWYKEMTTAFERVGRGERPTPEGVDYSDADTWNAKFAQDARPGSSALAEFDAAFQRYRAAAEALPEALYGIDPEKNRPLIGNRLLQTAGIGHFEGHQPQLLEWLGGRNA